MAPETIDAWTKLIFYMALYLVRFTLMVFSISSIFSFFERLRRQDEIITADHIYKIATLITILFLFMGWLF